MCLRFCWHLRSFLAWFCAELDVLFFKWHHSYSSHKTTGSLFCCLRSDDLGKLFLKEACPSLLFFRQLGWAFFAVELYQSWIPPWKLQKVERFYASTLIVYSDSVSWSSIDHWCAVGKFGPSRSVGGESGTFQSLHGALGIEWIAEGPRVFCRLIG